MAYRDLYKTKLCSLFARGSCPRASCTFAHGEDELRKAPPFGGERYSGHRGGDLRERLDRYSRRSPEGRRRYDSRRSPPRTGGRSLSLSPPRRQSRSRSPRRSPPRSSKDVRRPHGDRSDPRSEELPDGNRVQESHERQDLWERSAAKGYGRSSVDVEDLKKEKKLLQTEIQSLNDARKILEEKSDEKRRGSKELTAQVAALESNLQEAEEGAQAMMGKLKKLIKAHQRVVRAQDDVKKFQSKLHKLVEEMQPEEEQQEQNLINNAATDRGTSAAHGSAGSGPQGTETDGFDPSHGHPSNDAHFQRRKKSEDGREDGDNSRQRQRRKDEEVDEGRISRHAKMPGMKDVEIDYGATERDVSVHMYEAEGLDHNQLLLRRKTETMLSAGEVEASEPMALDMGGLKSAEDEAKSVADGGMASQQNAPRDKEERKDTLSVVKREDEDEDVDVDVDGDEGAI